MSREDYSTAERHIQILHLLSEEIFSEAKALTLEQRAPARDPDVSDDYMKEKKENILKLRKLREEAEVVFSGVML